MDLDDLTIDKLMEEEEDEVFVRAGEGLHFPGGEDLNRSDDEKDVAALGC